MNPDNRSPLVPDWSDVPERDSAEPDDADTDHQGIDADKEVGW